MALILLVDDDEAFRTMLRRALQRVGHDVVEASNGGAGLRALDARTVDLAIVDIIMPDVEGIETIQTLRKKHRDVLVFAMSGGGKVHPQSYLETAKAFGAACVFTKPFDIQELLAAIGDLRK